MRVENWPRLLDEYVESKRHEPFAWGSNDCIVFAADWIDLATGDSVFTPEYTDASGAAHEIAARGGLQQAITDVLGEPLERPMMAQRGDIGLVDIDGRLTTVVVIGALVVGPGESGMHAASLADLTVAWRV